jgi:hypothetical protein
MWLTPAKQKDRPKAISFVPLQLPLSPMSVFAIGIEHALDVTVKGPRPSTVLNGASENRRGYNDPNPEAEHFQKDSRKNGNSGGHVASPAKAVPCGNECRKSKTKRCHEDHEKQVDRENQHRVRQLPKRFEMGVEPMTILRFEKLMVRRSANCSGLPSAPTTSIASTSSQNSTRTV